MTTYVIEQHRTGETLSVVDAADEGAALDEYARGIGYLTFGEYSDRMELLPRDIRAVLMPTSRPH